MSGSSNFFLSPDNAKINESFPFKVLVTNARSLSPKIESLINAFTEHDIDVALVSESWLKDGSVLNRDVIDLEHGTNLKIIYKNRPKNSVGARKVGGGVSIIFNKDTCNLKERKIVGNKFELVVAVGRIGKLRRPVAIFSLYIEPRMKVDELSELNALLNSQVLQLKAKEDPVFLIGGDLNRRSLDDSLLDFPDIRQRNFEPTRGNACLDILFSNVDLNPTMWPPLVNQAGVPSDHSVLILAGEVPAVRNFVWKKKTTRKHTEQAVNSFGRALREVDWSRVLPPTSSADQMVDSFERLVAKLTDKFFPLVTTRYRSNDKPWITDAMRRLARLKKVVYRREGKSALWVTLRDRLWAKIAQGKENFIDTMSSHGGNSRKYFAAVKQVGSAGEGKEDWSLLDLYPDKTPAEAGNAAAEYFTKITDLFEPLEDDEQEAAIHPREPVTVEQVAKLLKDAKKPSSTVEGDVMPRLMKIHHPLFADPVTRIFNAVFLAGRWPAAWKTETAVIIPKTSNPDSLADCQNISCTAFLSKVLESLLLQDLRGEIPLDEEQYGGIKASSVDHLLVDIYDDVLSSLDKGGSAVVLGIDYQKAFNRLNHRECLAQLERLGASNQSLALVKSFLTGRRVRVKVDGTLSDCKSLNGGSPQGSILGCYLYCAATQQINLKLPRRPIPGAAPSPLPDRPAPAALPADDRDSPGMSLVPVVAPEVGDLDESSTDSFVSALSSLPPSPGEGVWEWTGIMVMYKYVDDTTTVELVPPGAAIRHVTGASPTESVPAPGTASAMAAIIQRANAIDMKVNCGKTQLLCVAPDNGYHSRTGIDVGGEWIVSEDTMKLLGFVMNSAGTVTDQVAHIKAKFRAKFWTLIHLRRAGIKGLQLFRLCTSLIRPILETNSVVWHSMLTKTQTVDIERLQKQAVKLCFGFEASYSRILDNWDIETLEDRRLKAVKRFVSKAIRNPRFAPRWFKRRQEDQHGIRRRRPFEERKANTNRFYNSPLMFMTRIANDLETNDN